MDLLGHNRQMARNSRWSNDRLYRAVLTLRPGEFEAVRTSFFPSISETLNHIYEVDLFYFDALVEAGEGRAIFARFDQFGDPEKLAAAQAELDDRLIAFCDGLSAADLDRRVPTDRGRRVSSPNISAVCWRISSCTRSTIVGRCMRCWRAPPSSRRRLTSFFSITICVSGKTRWRGWGWVRQAPRHRGRSGRRQ